MSAYTDIMRRIYIAGPMTGIPEHNYPAFHAAVAKLRAEGYAVTSPADLHGGNGVCPQQALAALAILDPRQAA